MAMFVAMQTRYRATYVLSDEPYHLPLDIFRVDKGVQVLFMQSIRFLRQCNTLLVLGVEIPVYETDPLCVSNLLSSCRVNKHFF